MTDPYNLQLLILDTFNLDLGITEANGVVRVNDEYTCWYCRKQTFVEGLAVALQRAAEVGEEADAPTRYRWLCELIDDDSSLEEVFNGNHA